MYVLILHHLIIFFSRNLQSREEWKIVFCISSAIYLFGAIFYGIFASGERQPWAIEKSDVEGEERSNKDDEKRVDDAHNNYTTSEMPAL